MCCHGNNNTSEHCTGQLGSEWVLLGVSNNSQHGDSERIRDKNDLKEGIDITGLTMFINDV